MSHEDSFFLKNKYGGYYFDPKLLDTKTLKNHLILHPVNPFELRDSFGRLIFDYTAYDDDFIEWCSQKWSMVILNDGVVNEVYYYFNISYIEDLNDYVSLCNNPNRLGACSKEYIESLFKPYPPNFFKWKNDPEPEVTEPEVKKKPQVYPKFDHKKTRSKHFSKKTFQNKGR